jgi:hypothetical protein
MTGDKFVFRQENLLLYLGFSILLNAECESQCIVWCVGKDSSEGWRDRLDTGVREANAEIQPGSYSSRFDILGVDGDHMVGLFPVIAYPPRRRHVLRRHGCQNIAA